MRHPFAAVALSAFLLLTTAACAGTTASAPAEPAGSSAPYESVEGQQIRMTSGEVEVLITLNDTRSAADLAAMLPLELELIERNGFAKGMRLPRQLSGQEETTRDYVIGDFGYWAAGPDLAIFYDDIYEQTIVEVIPLGHAAAGAEAMSATAGTVQLTLVEDGPAAED